MPVRGRGGHCAKCAPRGSADRRGDRLLLLECVQAAAHFVAADAPGLAARRHRALHLRNGRSGRIRGCDGTCHTVEVYLRLWLRLRPCGCDRHWSRRSARALACAWIGIGESSRNGATRSWLGCELGRGGVGFGRRCRTHVDRWARRRDLWHIRFVCRSLRLRQAQLDGLCPATGVRLGFCLLVNSCRIYRVGFNLSFGLLNYLAGFGS